MTAAEISEVPALTVPEAVAEIAAQLTGRGWVVIVARVGTLAGGVEVSRLGSLVCLVMVTPGEGQGPACWILGPGGRPVGPGWHAARTKADCARAGRAVVEVIKMRREVQNG